MSPTRATISTKAAPETIGPYSQAVRSGNMLFVSGQIGLDPQTGELVPGGVEAETDRALRNIEAIVEAGGSCMEQVLKTTCFLRGMGDFPTFNRVYERYFKTEPPARETVAVAGLPKGALVEVSCMAVVHES